jgi:glucosamine-phosphate N-acetyltransferase
MISSIYFQNIQKQLPKGFHIRMLAVDDYFKKYFELLRQQLTIIDRVDFTDFQKAFQTCLTNEKHTVVIEDVQNQNIIATGSIFIEQKFVHGCLKVGHIVDVAIQKDLDETNIIRSCLVQQLINIGRSLRVYKCVLDCPTNTRNFYESLGFVYEYCAMVRRFDYKGEGN